MNLREVRICSGPEPWQKDEQVSTSKWIRDGDIYTAQRQVRSWPGGGLESRDVLEIQRSDGCVEVYERTNEHPEMVRVKSVQIFEDEAEIEKGDLTAVLQVPAICPINN